MPIIDTAVVCVKHVGIVMFAYLVYLLAMSEKQCRARLIAGGAAAFLTGIAAAVTMRTIMPVYVIVMIAVFFIVMGPIFKIGPKKNLTLTLLSFGFSYIAYYISIVISIIYLELNVLAVLNRFGSHKEALDYVVTIVVDTEVSIVNQVCVTLIQGLILWLFLRTQRMKKGVASLVNFGMSDVGTYISIAAISIKVFQVLADNSGDGKSVTVFACAFLGMVCIFMLYFWMKNELRTAYKIKMDENELDLLEKSLESKDEMIKKLSADNETLAEIIHKDNKLIPSMVMSVRLAAEEMAKGDGENGEISKAVDAANSLDEIYARRSHALDEYESHGKTIIRTGVTAVDAVLLYMSCLAEEAGVAFSAEIGCDLAGLLDAVIEKGEFNTLLADLCENAIISAKKDPSGAVAVRLVHREGQDCLEVLDSGARFDIGVLKKMGKKRMTTHSGEGGSGIGLMTLFRILRQTAASYTLEEYPAGSGKYTKCVRVTFDGAGRRTIVTDRADDLGRPVRERFEVVRRNS